jgi:hypothetical protein
MRTTLELDEALVTRAGAVAAREGVPIHRFIEQLIEEGLAQRPAPPANDLPPLPILPGTGGLMPGVDPLSNASLYGDEDERIIQIARGENPDGRSW